MFRVRFRFRLRFGFRFRCRFRAYGLRFTVYGFRLGLVCLLRLGFVYRKPCPNLKPKVRNRKKGKVRICLFVLLSVCLLLSHPK